MGLGCLLESVKKGLAVSELTPLRLRWNIVLSMPSPKTSGGGGYYPYRPSTTKTVFP